MQAFEITHQFTYTNFFLKEIENCDEKNVSGFFFDIRNEGRRQFLDCNIMIPKPVDETVRLVLDIESTLDERIYTRLFTVRDKNACAAMHKYIGEFFYALERSGGLTPGVCPIRKKRLRIRNHYLDFSKVALQTFPFGHLRITTTLRDSENNDAVLFCMKLYVENVLN
ncbi:uncharacterized protein LOC116180219 [Photinus pyralis]|uniref:uncharacterized protein LOC116177698 n=1 Tax=Photinus pyralis TaxID=7054 RepID=UPI00126728B8|nr:uncharacterized protein LOC116177698 [Photinus pyralis]XP_031355963.1 uncharacterized protein LOC116180219 [Photinus pyralis]